MPAEPPCGRCDESDKRLDPGWDYCEIPCPCRLCRPEEHRSWLTNTNSRFLYVGDMVIDLFKLVGKP